MTKFTVLSLFFATLALTTSQFNDIENTIKFLSKFGYLPRSTSNQSVRIIDSKDYTNAVVKFQNFVGIPASGILDDATRSAMVKPRCGLADPTKPEKYVLAGKWAKSRLTYRVYQYTQKLSKREVDRELGRAFAVWQKHAKITFEPTNGRADIEIRFTAKGLPFNRFDGPRGVLAFAYYPQNGDIYFDDAEEWTAGYGFGTSLFQVAVHEIGHSLGLAHSNRKDAVMYPYLIAEYDDLNTDDVAGIQRLYGPRTTYSGGGSRPFYPQRRGGYPFLYTLRKIVG